MAMVDTYTATACGASHGGDYDVPMDDVDGWPSANLLGLVLVNGVNVCVTINRSTSKKTDEDDVTSVIDSHTTTCEACDEQWG